MTELSCTYGDDREEAIVSFLYGEPDTSPAEHAGFDAHLQTCRRCQADVGALRTVRAQLARWSPPEPGFAIRNSAPGDGSHPLMRNPTWWRTIPVWAQVAAAMLFLGVSAGVANLDVQYNQSGLTVRTGWSRVRTASGPDSAGPSTGNTAAVQPMNSTLPSPWRADLAALERQMKSEIRAVQASTSQAQTPVRAVSASATDTEVMRRVRAIVEESEKRQQRELALRVAELARDVTAQRQADMVKIDRTLGLVQNNVGIEVMKTRDKLNQMDLIYRASQRQ